ncbi:MAG TPA: hypothetical protein VEF34_10570 [Syntrophobacteraceae bacterium]|nr:hypothetical protein [Syntrophobacteraceae bacterium]
MTNLIIYCADIGSVKRNNFGWARLSVSEETGGCSTGSDMAQLAKEIAGDLNAGNRVALGFECPLFVPIADNPIELTAPRLGEGNRPWSAGAGAASLATGLTQTFWLLDRVQSLLKHEVPCFLNWSQFKSADKGLFLWEAFVSSDSKKNSHCDDAEAAALKFREGLEDPEALNAITPKKVRSLLGAALIQSGWTADIGCLGKPCLVVRV